MVHLMLCRAGFGRANAAKGQPRAAAPPAAFGNWQATVQVRQLATCGGAAFAASSSPVAQSLLSQSTRQLQDDTPARQTELRAALLCRHTMPPASLQTVQPRRTMRTCSWKRNANEHWQMCPRSLAVAAEAAQALVVVAGQLRCVSWKYPRCTRLVWAAVLCAGLRTFYVY